MSEINLVSKQKERITKLKKRVKLLRIIAFFCLIFVFTSSIFVFFIKLSSPLLSLQNQEKTLSANIDSSKQKIAKLFIVNDRLQNIESLLSKRANFNGTINAIVQQKPVDLSMTSLTVNKKNVSIKASSMSLTAINNFMDSLVVFAADKKMFNKITLENLSIDTEANQYVFSIKADLP